jgi:serine/threonine protein phosphatase PrpC
MRVGPERGNGAAVWHRDEGELVAVGVWTERRPGRGEDAEPLLAHHRPAGTGILGVFDGCGGSGSAVAGVLGRSGERTGAWLGARVARLGAEDWFARTVAARAEQRPDQLHQVLATLLAAARPATGKIGGSIHRALPTTLAAVCYRNLGAEVDCQALWAGDSRAYLLCPRRGLQQLTRDHTVETDALVQLVQDPPMTNVVCADRPFRIDAHRLVLALPCVLVAATDGFFGYVHAPPHFECHLLDTLRRSADVRDWSRRLADRVASYTGDDASLAMVGLGYAGFGALRDAFAARAEAVREQHWTPWHGQDPADEAAARRLRTESWDRYRAGYELRMPDIAGEGES